MNDDGTLQPLTLTHARLRARQGDRRGAAGILTRLIEQQPGDAGARRLLDEVARGPVFPARIEAREQPAPRTPADPSRLVSAFRRELGRASPARRSILRLQAWLDRLQGR